MALFPQSFLDDLKTQTDIVSIISEVMPLKKAGATLKGLCPFHQEKSPSFTVNRDKGVFQCFGCGVGGDVVKFIQLHQKSTFPEAVRYLAQRAAWRCPSWKAARMTGRRPPSVRRLSRCTKTRSCSFRSSWRRRPAPGPGGSWRRGWSRRRRWRPSDTATRRRAGGTLWSARFASKKVPRELQLRSGLIQERDGGRLADRFRNRLMIPIARDSGSVVAFGGRALDEGQVPKYLNSPETPIYTKGRTLYGLDVTKGAIRKHNYCVLVEGYFDLAQVWQAGVQPVVASCGTALTMTQARLLKRFASKVVLSFDPGHGRPECGGQVV